MMLFLFSDKQLNTTARAMETLEARLFDILESNPDPDEIMKLIERGVDCNLSKFDPNTDGFISPIELAAKQHAHRALCYLYEHRNSPTKAQLEKHLVFYINHYNLLQEEKNQLALEYIVSHLLHKDILEFDPEHFLIFINALNNIDGATRRGIDLSGGISYRVVLSVRIFTLVRYIVKMHMDFPLILDGEKLTVAENELLHTLEAYYYLYDVDKIPGPIPENLDIDEINKNQSLPLIQNYRCIANNIIKKIKQLDLNQEYTILTGWDAHAVCISFRSISPDHIYIRVDNPSHENPSGKHNTSAIAGKNYLAIEPKILGRLKKSDLNSNLNYFILLIDSCARELEEKNGISLIYNENNQIVGLDRENIESIPYFDEQAENNCAVKSWEIGFRMRLQENRKEFCESLLSFDRDNAYDLSKRCKDKRQSDPASTLYRLASLAKIDDGKKLSIEHIMQLQNELRRSYERHLQHLSSIWVSGSVEPTTDAYIPLTFEEDGTPIDLASSFANTRVLVLGEVGSGKTTACQHVTYLWACEEIWQNKFKWLFHIKMRNLNSRRYPPMQHTSYSLIDIIEKECFLEHALSGLGKLELNSQLANPSNILWILDGLDERAIPDHLHSIEEELLAKPHLLLTSRPHEFYDFQYDICAHVQSFTDQDIQNYINKYFSIMFRTTANQCWSFIHKSEQLLETARIPACLKVICHLWNNGKVKLNSKVTMGQLYKKMCEYLLCRYLLKFHSLCTSALVGRNIYQEVNAKAFTHLERLAFQATKSHQLTISREEITDVAGSLSSSVLQIGLLVPETQNYSSLLLENSYYFIHRSFQEYLCARYMIDVLESDGSHEQKTEVIHFIGNEKYNRRIQNVFRLFFELERSSSCTNQFWSIVDGEPRDLLGLRHCSRISHWFPKGSSRFSKEDRENIRKRTTEVIRTWISNQDRLPHDTSNAYIFESFADATGRRCWLDGWRQDLFIKDPLKRHYLLHDLWSMENINALKTVYDDISGDLHKLHSLITTGPNTRSLKLLNLKDNLFNLYTTDSQTKIPKLLKKAQEQTRKHESVTTAIEFQALLENYQSFTNLNRQSMALGSIIWSLNVDPSALINVNNDMLLRLLHIIQKDELFFRYFKLPAIHFLRLYATQNDLNEDILCSLIVLCAASSDCIFTALSGRKKLIRIFENDIFTDIEMDECRLIRLLNEFDKARNVYGYSSFFQMKQFD
ncbi:unnamed protein product [Adineta ricciae]|uniref:NACHT domain-containing protein n=1 Tax=Adineta ricciae TaxID=249248 RepID=A0A815NTS8_ADIRI|nr:unnamed protein product [Adineta ricciae]CAF1610451.1 unnamed protein product [Adineta ricciae]